MSSDRDKTIPVEPDLHWLFKIAAIFCNTRMKQLAHIMFVSFLNQPSNQALRDHIEAVIHSRTNAGFATIADQLASAILAGRG